ncbi:hypothetical protein ACWX0O_01685 [Nitrobacteraceae bacterium UC4449_H16]
MTKATKATTVSAPKAAKAVKTVAEPTMKLFSGQPAIEAALKSIFTRGQSLQKDIHIAACSVLAHIGKHNDIRLATTLLAAMPEASRKNAMRDWLSFYGPITFEGDKPVHVKGGKVSLGAAMANPFWSFSPEKPYEALDIAKFIASAVKKLEKDAKETKVDHSAIINAMQKLVPANKLAA